MPRALLLLASLNGGCAVALGAFAAHGLAARLSPELLATFETAARYHMYHALATGLAALVAERAPGRGAVGAGWCFIVGILLFSGSLYMLVLTGQRWLGAVTPFGGVAFLAGWACLARAAYASSSSRV